MSESVRERVFAAIAADPKKPIPLIAKEIGCTKTYAYRVIAEAKQDMVDTKGITCPECGSMSVGVKDSRPSEILGDTTMRRRRGCKECHHVWTTFEVRDQRIEDLEDRIRADVAATVLAAMNVTPEYILDLLIQSREKSL